MKEVAVIGGGMTLFRRHLKETGKELSYLATKMAMEDSGIQIDDIDMVVMGSAPDAFDGIHMKGENLIDGCAAKNKPYVRVFNGGGTGVFAPIAGWWHVASGVADVALVVCEEKMSSCFPHPQTAFRHIWDPFLDRPLNPNLVWLFAMEMNRYMTVHNIKKEDIALVSVKNKRNAVGHPCAQLADPNITVEDVLNSEIMAWPVNRLDVSPPSDGASALIFCNKDIVHKFTDDPIYVAGTGWNIDSTMWTNRDLYFPRYVAQAAKMAYKMAKIENPRKEIDFAEVDDTYAYKELQSLEALGIFTNGEAGDRVIDGFTSPEGEFPVNISGGSLGCGHLLDATGLVRALEVVLQLRYQAGPRQLENVEIGLAQSWRGVPTTSGAVAILSN